MATIKELRAKTGMTQTEFGEWLGIPMRTIQNWENGQRSAPEYVVELIAFRIEAPAEMAARIKDEMPPMIDAYFADGEMQNKELFEDLCEIVDEIRDEITHRKTE